MALKFYLDIVPPRTTHQMKKVAMVGGRPRFYEPPKLKAARELLMLELKKHAPEQPFEGAVKLEVAWDFQLGKGSRYHDGDWKTTRPDTDNLQKLLKDCMTATGFWKDDAQVVLETVQKRWAVFPGIWVTVAELDRTDDVP